MNIYLTVHSYEHKLYLVHWLKLLVLPGELAKHAASEGIKVVPKFTRVEEGEIGRELQCGDSNPHQQGESSSSQPTKLLPQLLMPPGATTAETTVPTPAEQNPIIIEDDDEAMNEDIPLSNRTRISTPPLSTHPPETTNIPPSFE
ncbi:hypothetical protein RND71_018099 [Anisodus tanguticus]|uniref:Uncharacterized protein n=1 Tax=Anisodus tanguticus TaxID=243964 RepID=A0AAE1VAM0_9SOLA|nr:hypothetical protein RND71_018099 [Anisodus tanguticus]